MSIRYLTLFLVLGRRDLQAQKMIWHPLRIWSHFPCRLKVMWKNGTRWTREDGAEPWQLPKQLLYP
nr:MAG TPA: hypothetical protein [Caudoviricetes sp.]